MKPQDIIDAYTRIRKIDQTIPDEVLDFMKDEAVEALRKQDLPSTLDAAKEMIATLEKTVALRDKEISLQNKAIEIQNKIIDNYKGMI